MMRAPLVTLVSLLALPAAADRRTFRMLWLFSGTISDMGYNFQHNDGRIRAQEYLVGKYPDMSFHSEIVEGVEFEAAEQPVEEYSAKGYDFIIGTSFVHMNALFSASKRYPKTHYLHIYGYLPGPDNIAILYPDVSHGFYLGGLVAGARAKRACYLAPMVQVPSSIRHLMGFAKGVRDANPEGEVVVQWLGSYMDDVREAEAGRRFAKIGCEVMTHHTDTHMIDIEAKAAGRYSIGYNSDVRRMVGDGVLTSIMTNWSVAYLHFIERVIAGTHRYERLVGGLDNLPRFYQLAPYSFAVDESTRRIVEERTAEIASGNPETRVFCGESVRGVALPGERCIQEEVVSKADFWLPYVRNLHPPEQGVRLFGEACPEGSVYEEVVDPVGGTYEIRCQECPNGTFSVHRSALEGAAVCTPCPRGTSSPRGAPNCTECPKGTYSPNEGAEMCLPCPDGTSTHGTGNMRCYTVEERENTMLVVIVISVASVLLAGAGGAAWKATFNMREYRRMYNTTRLAEDMAVQIASMNLEPLNYLYNIPRPTSTQRAFITIIEHLKCYRAYLPTSLLAGTEDEGSEEKDEDGVDDELEKMNEECGDTGSTVSTNSSRAMVHTVSVKAVRVKLRSGRASLARVVVHGEHLLNGLQQLCETIEDVAVECRGLVERVHADSATVNWIGERDARLASHSVAFAVSLQERAAMHLNTGVWTGGVAYGTYGSPTLRFCGLASHPKAVYALSALAKIISRPVLVCHTTAIALRSEYLCYPIERVVGMGGPPFVYEVARRTEHEEWMYELEGEEEQRHRRLFKGLLEGKVEEALREAEQLITEAKQVPEAYRYLVEFASQRSQGGGVAWRHFYDSGFDDVSCEEVDLTAREPPLTPTHRPSAPAAGSNSSPDGLCHVAGHSPL